MKISLLIFGLNVFPILCSAQLDNKGWWTRDLFHFQWHNDPSDNSSEFDRHYLRFYTQPEIGYAINDRMLVGIVTQYEFIKDRYEVPANASGITESRSQFYGAGPLFRYFIPLGNRISFMPEFFLFYSTEKFTDIYSEAGHITEEKYSQNTFGAGAFPSFVCFLNRDIAVSITVVSALYYGNEDSQSIDIAINPQQWLLGVEYYFNKKKIVQ